MVIKRNYNIPLRKEFQKVAYYKKSKKAITAVIDFLKKHMKSDNIKIGKHLNEKVWKNGIRNPPHHVEIVAIKDDEGVVKAELVGFESEIEPKEEKKAEKKTESKVTKTEKPEETSETLEEAVAEEKVEDKAETKKEAPKPKKAPAKKKED
ncbi:hypothetical protein C0585_02245 [Candidatus Woesearchaeota archaeon]|nr:MAG: hypothetical protein C0585_02245 [Candidatus Woesearchaeota archaeon]